MAEMTEKGFLPSVVNEIVDQFVTAHYGGAYSRSNNTFTQNHVEYVELEPLLRKIAEEVLRDEMQARGRSYKEVVLEFLVDQAMENLD